MNPSRFGNKNYKFTVLPLFAFRTLQQMLLGIFSVQRDYSLSGRFPIIQSINNLRANHGISPKVNPLY